MLQFMRPRRPAGFAASVRSAQDIVRAAALAGDAPVFDQTLWQKHKHAFIKAQWGKCGYCETYSMNHPGAVEHFAPKSEVQELLDEGVEVDSTAQVERRKTPALCSGGYWWLSYSWDNWLFACERCNSAWKRCLFPVRTKRRTLPPEPGKKEAPLLLSPFGKVDPTEHLRFSKAGQIAARSRSYRGEATIKTCGLDRESLRRAREGIAMNTYRYVDRLLFALKTNDLSKAHWAVEDLLSLGAETRAHAGMVRSIVSEKLGYDWVDVKRLEKRLRGLPRRRDSR